MIRLEMKKMWKVTDQTPMKTIVGYKNGDGQGTLCEQTTKQHSKGEKRKDVKNILQSCFKDKESGRIVFMAFIRTGLKSNDDRERKRKYK